MATIGPPTEQTRVAGPRGIAARRLGVAAGATGRAALSLVVRRSPDDPAEAILTHHARTFAFAARWLPDEQRRAVIVLYAFCRTLDDLVDEPAPDTRLVDALAELEAWRRWLRGGQVVPAPREPLGQRLAWVLARYGVPLDCLVDLIDGLVADTAPAEIGDVRALRRYCYQVAGTVGIAMAHVLGATTPAATAAAENLGVAMQLTNILRDIGEDLGRGRLYLPVDELALDGSSRTHLLGLRAAGRGPDDRFRAVVRRQVERARAWYDQGLVGIDLLPCECQLPILIAGRLYRRILTVIERQDYDVLRRRAATGRAEKAWEATCVLAGWCVPTSSRARTERAGDDG